MSILIAFINDSAGGRMKWFKHYSTAEFSESLSNIEENFGFEGLGRYWRFMEFLSRQLENDDVSFRVQRAKIRELLRFRSWNDLETFVDHLGTVRGMEVDRSENVYEIKAPILLELQQKDFKKTRKDRGEDAAKNKKENKIKKENKKKSLAVATLVASPSHVEVLNPTPTQKTWEAYRESYLLRWKQEPTRNATVNGQIKNFVARVGEQDAPEIAKFYVGHHKRYYVENCHPVGVMLKDAEALATQWKNNRQITSADAKNIESMGGMAETYKAIKEGNI